MKELTELIQTPAGFAIVVFGGIVATMIFARLAFFGMFLLAIPISAAVGGLRSGIRGFAARDRTDKVKEMEKVSTPIVQRFNASGTKKVDASSIAEGFWMPRNLLYHPKHIWMKQEPYGKVRIGFDEFAYRLMGSIQRIDFLTFNVQKLGKDGWQTSQSYLRGWDLYCDGKSVRINSSIQGRIVEINTQLYQEPSKIAENLYGEGWLCTIMPEGDANPMYDAVSDTQIDKWMKDEVNRLRHCVRDQGIAALHDGGEIVKDIAAAISESDWKQLVKYFISV